MGLADVAALGLTDVQQIDQTLSLQAADYSLEHKLHMADALIYATARRRGAELYPSDLHLKGLKGVSYL